MIRQISIFLLLTVCFNLSGRSQDTTVVQTLDFSDITKRRGWYAFPPDTGSYRQILMYYTLKCDPATTQDQYNCGEWDYTTYTNIYQHQNVGSLRYTINGTSPDVINYSIQPGWNYYQSYDYFIVYDNTISENDYPIISGNSGLNRVLATDNHSGRSQYIFTAAELLSAGVTPGNVDKLRMNILTIGSNANNLTIRMKNSALTELTAGSYETSGFSQVFNGNLTLTTTGTHDFDLTTPFNWDGVSNVVVDFAFTNTTSGIAHVVEGGATGFNAGVQSESSEGYLEFAKPDYIEIPATAFAGIDSFITVSFWQYGDPAGQPVESYLFEAIDSSNRRVLNTHVPWGNGEVYWDAGNSGTGSYDRINKPALQNNYAGQWNHWAFVKDVGSGTMTIYLNGNVWHSGTGKNRTMDGIAKFRIAAPATGTGSYNGLIDEFRIWDASLSQTDIQDWMHKTVTGSHPNYPELVLAYGFDQPQNGPLALDYSPNNNHGSLIGLPDHKIVSGTEIDRNMPGTDMRPNITFVQGTYVSHLDSVIVTDSVPTGTYSILVDSTSRNLTGAGISFHPIDTIYGYPAGITTYTYDPAGAKIDSAYVVPTNQLLNNFKSLTHQLQNYVTPYGIGLNLGPNGFRWVYDVTDYLPLLKDTVDISAGNQQELIDLKFVFISGTPPRDILDFKTIWLGDYDHADIANDVAMPAVNIPLESAAHYYTVRTRTTGHWFGGFQNCAEFCPKYHNLSINGVQQFEWLNWKECSTNPVVDQGGTWIYDRAGWCPGTFAETFNHDITPHVNPGDTVSIDYGMEYTSGGMEGNYRTTVQLFSYGDYNFSSDAAVVDVIAPNKWEFHNRFNPICGRPVVVIRNDGSDTLTSLNITYRVMGGVDVDYPWTGSLAFGEEEMIELYAVGPWFWSAGTGNQKFEVVVSDPNGNTDQNPDNDYYQTEYDLPPSLPEDWYLWIQTNSAGHENSYYIYNMAGDTLYQRAVWSSNTVYRDTFHLQPGCYTLEITDSDEDGVSFFANSDGNGWIRWRPVNGGSIYTFEPNFGDKIIYNFMVGGVLSTETIQRPYLEIYPNPSEGAFTIESEGFIGDVDLTVFASDGQIVHRDRYEGIVGSVNTTLNLESLSPGIYLVVMSDGTRQNTRKLILK